MSNQRFIFLAFLVCAISAGAVLRSASVSVMLSLGSYGLADHMVLGLMPLSSVIGIVGGILTFFALFKNTRAVSYADEAIGELVKVTWPDREETINSSLIVIVTSVIFSGSLAIFDFVWARVTNLILFTAG